MEFLAMILASPPHGLSLTLLQAAADHSGIVPEQSFAQAIGFWGVLVTTMMAVLFVLGLRWYILPLWTTSRAFRRARERVKANRTQRVLFPTRPKHLNDLWGQYLADRAGTTVKVGNEEISTVDPEDTFTEHAVLEGYNRNLALAFAGVFTGLGILGTFLGLVDGLDGIGGTQQTELMSSILELLGGMSTAFYTSIFGIALSLVWLFADRVLYHQVQRHVSRFFLAVRKAYPVESADRLLHRLLAVEQEESAAIHETNRILNDHGDIHVSSGGELLRGNQLLEEQKAILQTLGTDLAVAFQDALSSSLGNHVTPLLQGVIESVNSLSTQMGERQVQLIGELVDHFQSTLSNQLSGHFEHLAGALKDAAEWQQRVHGDLEQLLDTINTATQGQLAVIERSTDACDLFHRSLGELETSHQLIAQSSQQVEGSSVRISGELESFGSRMTAQLEEVANAMVRNLERSAAMVDGMAEALTESVERLDLQARSLEKQIASLDAQQETYREANEEIRTYLATHIDQLGQQVGALQGFWTQFREDLASVGDGLRDSVAEFSVFTAEKLREIFARFDAEMAKVVEHLSGTLADLREVTEDLPGGVERLRDSLEDAVKPIAETGRTLSTLPDNLKRLEDLTEAVQALAPLGDRIREAAQQVSGTDRSIVKLSEQLESTGKQVSLAVSVFDKSKHNGEPGSAQAGAQPLSPVVQR
jgi:methyl-accepting chemotaxis protein